MATEIRLNKFLAQAGITSRRKADELIRKGCVRVDGKVVLEPGLRVNPAIQKVEVEGKPVRLPPPVYYLFYKPAGYLTALSDPHGRRTIAEFLKKLPVRVFPVGRLDADTEGLLLLTNDGDLAHRLLHPRFGIKRVYHATVRGHPSPEVLKRLIREGVEVEGRRVYPKSIKILGKTSRTTTLEVVVGEGRKREVRKIFASVGHPVIKLKRVAFGPLLLKGLRPGEIRPLSPKEIRVLKKTAGLL